MEVKKGYKMTEVGVIPEDWEFINLTEAVDYIHGKAHEPFVSEFGTFPIVNSKFISTEGTVVKYSTVNLLPARYGDVLTVLSDLPNGRALAKCFYIVQPNAYAVNQRICIWRSKKNADGKFLFHLLNRNKYFLALDNGVSQTHILNHHINSCKIQLPPLAEQTAIATALSDMDALIAQTEKLIEKKKAIRQGVMQRLLSPVDAEGKVKEGWVKKRLGDIFTFGSTASYSRAQLSSSDKVGYIHYGDIHVKFDTYLDTGSVALPRISEEAASKYTSLKDGDIVMADASEDYAGVGKAVEISNLKGQRIIAGLHTYLLRDDKGEYQDGFKGLLFESKYVKDQLTTLASGLKVYSISKSVLVTLALYVPPSDEQKAISASIKEIINELGILEKKLKKLHYQKQAMMQSLLTGRIRLIKPTS